MNALPSTSSSYTPVAPFQATCQSILSQDIIVTDTIPVVSTSPGPVGVFTNPNAGGIAGNAGTEALAIVPTDQNGSPVGQLTHVARDASTDAGWTTVILFGGVTPTEVATGTAFANTSSSAVYGFYQDANGFNVTQLQSDGRTWSQPSTISGETVANLRVAYSPAGALVAYGGTSGGDLFTATQASVGGDFTATVTGMNQGLISGDFQLTLTDERNWTIISNVNGGPVVFVGQLGATEFSSSDQVTSFGGTLAQTVLGYWSIAQNTLMFLLVDSDDALHVWSQGLTTTGAAIRQIPNSSVKQAVGHVTPDGALSVYSVDMGQNLWVLHQSASNPWNFDGTPNWAPYLPLDTGIAGLAADLTPTDAPSLFALDAADFSLRLHRQDSVSSLWQSGQVLQTGTSTFDVTRFRTEVSLFDANGVPVAETAVTLAVQENNSTVTIWSGGQTYAVGTTPIPLATDSTGKLTFSILATEGISVSNLILTADGLPNPMTIVPAGPVHTYLSGQGILNPTNPGGPLSIFDAQGITLTGATVGGQALAPGISGQPSLAPVAAQSIQAIAQTGLGTATTDAAGFSISFRTGGNHVFRRHATVAELAEQRKRMFSGSPASLDSIWSDIESWFGDLWEGIKNGVIQIVDALVTIADDVATFTLKIGDAIAQEVQIALQGIEHAAHFIAGVFQAVGAEIEKVVDWLKALFDFGAIWRTKMAFEQALTTLPGYVQNLTTLGQMAADQWFSKQKDAVDAYFSKIEAKFGGQSFDQLPGWQPLGQPPNSQTPVAGNATPADLTGNVHHNWLQDKVSSYAPATSPFASDSSFEQAWSNFGDALNNAATDFIAAITDFKNGFSSLIEKPTSFGSVGLPELLASVQKLIDTLLDLLDAVLDGLLAIINTAMAAFDTLLTTPLNLGFLNTIWSWMAKEAGFPDDDQLTAAALLALVGAFPSTVIFKLINGVNTEPFPANQSATRAAAVPPAVQQLAAIVGVLEVVPDVVGALLGANSPWWLTLISVGMGGGSWAFGSGFPDLSNLDWSTAGAVAANLVWITPGIGLSIKAAQAMFPGAGSQVKDASNVLLSVTGASQLIVGIVDAAENAPDAATIAGNFLSPLSNLFSLLNLSAFQGDPFTIAALVVVNFVSDVGGGIADLIDVPSGQSAFAA